MHKYDLRHQSFASWARLRVIWLNSQRFSLSRMVLLYFILPRSMGSSWDSLIMAEVQRRALVIGSQCDSFGESMRLSFLPDLAIELYEVMTDPRLGACEPGLPDRSAGGLLLDPTHDQVLDALEEAFIQANSVDQQADGTGSTLFVALLGHGMAVGEDFYFLSKNSAGQGRTRGDVHLSQELKQLLRDSADLSGLIVWLDTCHSGVAAQQGATEWAQTGLGKNVRRYELLSAADDNPAYGGDFTRALIGALRRGIPTAGDTIDANALRGPLQKGTPAQRPQRVTVDGGGWAQDGDKGLWLGYNRAFANDADDIASVAVHARISELIECLQPTDTLDALVSTAQGHQCVVLTGARGSGKSTLSAALAQPAEAGGHVPDGFVHAIAFARSTSTMETLTNALAGQLRVTVDGFARAVNEFDGRLDAAERRGLPALDRRVLGPLRMLTLEHPIRLVIDALDELPQATQHIVRTAITAAHTSDGGSPDIAGVSFVLTARPGAPVPPGAHVLPVEEPGDDVLGAYLRRRGVAEEHLPMLVEKTGGNWLHAYLLSEQAVRPGFAPGRLPSEVSPSLIELYEAELLAAGADDPDRWESQLRPVLAVCAAAGVGPVMPLQLAVAAAGRLGGPSTSTRFRDSLVRLSGLTVRSRPGLPEERVGIFHLSLTEDYLLRPDLNIRFAIDAREAHLAIVAALRELAPVDQHDPNDPLDGYAMYAEPDHLLAGGKVDDVIESLVGRPLRRAADERERWYRWAIQINEALGPQHSDTLTAREHLARWTGEAGDASAARDQYAELLPLYEQVWSPEHHDTLKVRGRLARWTGEAGDVSAARDQYAALVPLRERVLGPEDPSTLRGRCDHARWTGEAGDAGAARTQLATLVPLFERVLGAEHPDTLMVRGRLARWTGEAGDAGAARDQFAALVPLFERVSGPEHPETLRARGNFAYLSGEAGDAGAARDQYAALVPLRERVSGPKHPDTLVVRANLARWTGEAGDAGAARDQYAALLPLLEQVSGPEHPRTLTVRANLTRWTGEAGNAGAARTQLATLVPLFERVSGPEHPDTLMVRGSLARWTGEAGDAGTARDQYAALLPLRERVSGPKHPNTLRIRANLAHWTGEAGDAGTARDQFAALLPLLEQVSGPEHPRTLTVRANLAHWTGEAGDAGTARDQFAALLPLLEQVSGPEHPNPLMIRANLAHWAAKAGDPGADRA
ncbi:AAA family ATPase [Nocardia vinacea]|uniref:tetratricopeptide repeat protein n=1 Tax=Nocardia vinacea TaxID=96468 RepID=UPI002E13F3C4|nr:AAA family ATPase [Nocardia vinacea]